MRHQGTGRAAAAPAALLLILGGLLSACAPFSGPLPGGAQPPAVFIQHTPGQGEFTYSIDLGSKPKSVYFTMTNPDPRLAAQSIPTIAGADAAHAGGDARSVRVPAMPSWTAVGATPTRVSEFNRDPFSRVGGGARLGPSRDLSGIPEPTPDAVNDNRTMYDTRPNSAEYDFFATCKYVSNPAVDVGGSQTRKLNIWVQDWCLSATTGHEKAFYVSQAMVNNLAAAFLSSSAFNDIYDWVTTMIGAEWGPHPYTNLIPPNNEITILLCDIEDDNSPDGGVIGFFWAKDNFKDAYVYQPDPGQPNYFPYHSHERIMFYIDAVMLANPFPPGRWEEEVASTLAHEFQHMVNFYQKLVVAGAARGPDTWINELCSQSVEDLLADKLLVPGPRGVDGTEGSAGPLNNPNGRLPLFNAYDSVSLSDWGDSGLLQSYSASYAFGAYLTRNYGGAGLIRAMVQSPLTGPDQIVAAVSERTGRQETFGGLLQRWSLALLLSDHLDAPDEYAFNTGDFFLSSTGGQSYRVGSINFFNYQRDGYPGATGPALYSGSGLVGTTPPLPASGILYLAADNATGTRTWSVVLPKGISMSVVVK